MSEAAHLYVREVNSQALPWPKLTELAVSKLEPESCLQLCLLAGSWFRGGASPREGGDMRDGECGVHSGRERSRHGSGGVSAGEQS